MGEQRNKIFVGGVSWATDEKKFTDHFGPFGEITDCVIMRNLTTGNSRGFGFVTFADSSSVDKVFEVPEHNIDGKKLDLKIAVARGEMTRPGQPQDQKARRTCKVFLGGIHLETTKTELEEYFGKYGPVAEAVVMMDRESGRSRGFGFVTFQSEDTVDRLLQEEHEIRGRKIDCKKAIPREETAEVPNFRPRMPSFQPAVNMNMGNFDRDVRGYYEQRAAEDARRVMGGGRAPEQFRERDQNDRYGGPKSAPVFPNQTPSYASPAPAYATQAPAYASQTNVYATQAPRAAPYSPTPNVYASNGFGASNSYTNGPPANAWDYTPPTQAAYGGANYAAEPAYLQATTFPQAGYGAARSTATATSRYRPY
jgi:RNA recognition motif-containing protein